MYFHYQSVKNWFNNRLLEFSSFCVYRAWDQKCSRAVFPYNLGSDCVSCSFIVLGEFQWILKVRGTPWLSPVDLGFGSRVSLLLFSNFTSWFFHNSCIEIFIFNVKPIVVFYLSCLYVLCENMNFCFMWQNIGDIEYPSVISGFEVIHVLSLHSL